MTTNATQLLRLLAALTLLGIGWAIGHWWPRPGTDASHTQAAPERDERRVLYWYDPMVPDQHFEHPGRSPFMDMDLVPRYADKGLEGGVYIDSDLRQSVGIHVAQVAIGQLSPTLRVPGALAWDPLLESVVAARVEALVTRLSVKAPYTPVRRGQTLATLLAPDWTSALAEAQALQDAESATARELHAAAQQRLRALGVPSGASSATITLTAPHDGVLTEVLVREGQAVTPGTLLFRINGLDTLWLEAAVPQALAMHLHAGTPIHATIDALPGESFDGHVETLLPQVDAASGTQPARIVLNNPEGRLAPGMFAQVLLHPEPGPALPLIPTQALIATGSDSRVIVQTADGRFQPVSVRTGRSDGGHTEIISGLRGGERVVVSGQFLIDSEASLSGALERLRQSVPEPTPAHNHTGHDAHAGHGQHEHEAHEEHEYHRHHRATAQ